MPGFLNGPLPTVPANPETAEKLLELLLDVIKTFPFPVVSLMLLRPRAKKEEPVMLVIGTLMKGGLTICIPIKFFDQLPKCEKPAREVGKTCENAKLVRPKIQILLKKFLADPSILKVTYGMAPFKWRMSSIFQGLGMLWKGVRSLIDTFELYNGRVTVIGTLEETVRLELGETRGFWRHFGLPECHHLSHTFNALFRQVGSVKSSPIDDIMWCTMGNLQDIGSR